MYKAFLAVLHDLLAFVWDSIRGRGAKKTDKALIVEKEFVHRLDGTKAGVDLGYAVYVVQDSLLCYEQPRKKGACLATFTYGDTVLQTRVLDGAVFVSSGDVEGWVEASGVTAASEQVFPVFIPSVVYDASNIQVVKVRKYLKRFERQSKQCLSAEEFVLYMLQSTGVPILWEQMNATFPPSWYQRFIGRRGVTVESEPRTHSVLEYTTKAGDFFQGYVREVHPDQTIVLESVGRVLAGEYRVEELPATAWKKWQSSFISFS